MGGNQKTVKEGGGIIVKLKTTQVEMKGKGQDYPLENRCRHVSRD